eukprot:213129-Rhodomonas_salina.1
MFDLHSSALTSYQVLIVGVGGACATLLLLRMLPSKPQGPGPDRIGRKAQNIRNDTLIPLLHEHMIPMEKIEQDYPAFTSIVRVLIGIVPRCDAYLEIWPTAFKSYNLIVPNLMNV